MNFIPYVSYKKEGGREVTIDIFSRLLGMGIIFINGEITMETATIFLASVLHIRNDLLLKTVHVYINSPGGLLYSGLAIVDIMLSSDIEFKTYCIGVAASAASLIFAAGCIRIAIKNSRIIIHQPLGATKGQASDIQIYAAHIGQLKQMTAEFYHIFSRKTATTKYFLGAIDRDKYLTPLEGKELGLVDYIVEQIKYT